MRHRKSTSRDLKWKLIKWILDKEKSYERGPDEVALGLLNRHHILNKREPEYFTPKQSNKIRDYKFFLIVSTQFKQ
jgi:hypothetical protein